MAENLSTPIQETQHAHCINESKELRRSLANEEYIRKNYEETIHRQRQTIQECCKEIDDLRREIFLKNAIIEQVSISKLKGTHLQHLQYSGQLCANNCFLCTILWICQKKLGVFPCGLQLLLQLLLSKYKSTEEIKPENHMCHKLIVMCHKLIGSSILLN